MNFTREPLIETVITAKEGYKLVLRNSKGSGQEEFFVDALEVISFGNSCFYRSLEKPKSFLVPVTDYEIIEVREHRMVLKTGAVEKGGIKIAGGRETAMKAPREEKEEIVLETSEVESTESEEPKIEKKRERRRTRKRRKGEQERPETLPPAAAEKPTRQGEKPTLIPPPSTLISETINRYKEIAIHETKEEEAPLKKEEEFFEGPSEDSSESMKRAQPQVEDDEEIPF